MESFVPPLQTPDSEIVSLSPSFDPLSPLLGMTESNSPTNAMQLDVPELELLSPQVDSLCCQGLDPLTGISLEKAENLTIPEDIGFENTDLLLMSPDTAQITTGIDEAQALVSVEAQKKPQRESIREQVSFVRT